MAARTSGIGHCRLISVIDQVIAFDFHPGERVVVVELEAGLREHRFEDVEAQLHLAPVLLTDRRSNT